MILKVKYYAYLRYSGKFCFYNHNNRLVRLALYDFDTSSLNKILQFGCLDEQM